MSAVTIQQMAERVAALMEDRLQARGDGLARKLKKAGRLLPRKVHQAANRLATAWVQSHNPKLLLQIDEAAVAADYDLCVRHLSAINPLLGRWRGVMRVISSVLVGLLVLGLVALAFFAFRDDF